MTNQNSYEDVVVLGAGIEGKLMASLLPGCTLIRCSLEEDSVYSPLKAGGEGMAWHKRNPYTIPIYKDRAFKLSSYLNLWRKPQEFGWSGTEAWGKAGALYKEYVFKLYCRSHLEELDSIFTKFKVPGRKERYKLLRAEKPNNDPPLLCLDKVNFWHANTFDSVTIHDSNVLLRGESVKVNSIVNTLRPDLFFRGGGDWKKYLRTSRAQVINIPGGPIYSTDYDDIIDINYRTIRVEHDGNNHTVYMLLFPDEDCILDEKVMVREIGWLGSMGIFGELYGYGSAPDYRKVIDYVPYLDEGINHVLKEWERVGIYSLGMWGRWDDTMDNVNVINSDAHRIKSLIDERREEHDEFVLTKSNT